MNHTDEIKSIEQLARALNLALKHSSPETRNILNKKGFIKNKRIVVQRFTYLLVSACRKSEAK